MKRAGVTFTLHPDLVDDVRGYAEAKAMTVQDAVDRLLSTGLTRAAAIARYESTGKGFAARQRADARKKKARSAAPASTAR